MAAKQDGSQTVVRTGDSLAVGRLGAGTAQGDQGGKTGNIILIYLFIRNYGNVCKKSTDISVILL